MLYHPSFARNNTATTHVLYIHELKVQQDHKKKMSTFRSTSIKNHFLKPGPTILPRRKIITINEDKTLRSALSLLNTHSIMSCPVVQSKSGIYTGLVETAQMVGQGCMSLYATPEPKMSVNFIAMYAPFYLSFEMRVWSVYTACST